MHCYHHNDADGLAAGYLVKRICDSRGIPYTPSDFSCVDYNSAFNDHDDMEDVIFIVDLSFTEATVNKLIRVCRHAKKVIWVDHHKSSADLFRSKEFKNIVMGSFDNLFIFFTETGCGALNTYRLTHNLGEGSTYSDNGPFYFYQAMKEETKSTIFELPELTPEQRYHIPLWLTFIDDYDRWIKKLPDTDDFQLGLMSEENHVIYKNSEGVMDFNPFWDKLSKPDSAYVHELTNDGRAISKYINARYKREFNKTFQVYLPTGEIILCKNASGNSDNFLDAIKHYDAVSLFHYDGRSGKWYHSIYAHENSKFDCAKFAEQYGGGGHFHAAGFNIDYPLWTTDLGKTK